MKYLLSSITAIFFFISFIGMRVKPVSAQCATPATPTNIHIFATTTPAIETTNIPTKSIKVTWTYDTLANTSTGWGTCSNADNENYFILSIQGTDSSTSSISKQYNISPTVNGICTSSDTASCSFTTGAILTVNGTYSIQLGASNNVDACSNATAQTITKITGFVKLKNSTYFDHLATSTKFPASASLQTYDTDDAGDNYFNSGSSPGLVATGGTPNFSTAGVSTNGWAASPYTVDSTAIGTKYINYVKSRRTYTSIANMDEITGDGTFLYTGNLTLSGPLDVTILNNRKVVLLVEGILTLGTNITPTNGYVGMVAQTLVVQDAVSAITGIFSADNVRLSTTAGIESNTPLKIVGAISSGYSASSNTIGIRTRVDNLNKPSLFIIQDPAIFLNVMPYLSVTRIDWRQIQ